MNAKTKNPQPRYVTCRANVDQLSVEARKIIRDCQQYEQEIVNRIWQRWLFDSINAGKDADLRIFLECHKRWKEGGQKGERPKLEFYAVENDFPKKMMCILQESHPCYHVRCVNLTLQRVVGNIKNNVSRTCNLKLWQAVLLGRERMCASEGAIAVPFDGANGKLEWADGHVYLTIRIDRIETDKVNATSTPIKMRLRTNRMSDRFKLLLAQAAQGLRKWRGSKIRYDSRKRQYVACIVIEDEQPKPMMKRGETAKLSAPKEGACWLLKIGDKETRIGSGRSIAYLRNRLRRENEVRNRPDFPGNRRRGHSLLRWLRGNRRLHDLWLNKTKTWNGQAVATIIRTCNQEGVAFIEVEKPDHSSLLNTAGGDIGPAWPSYEFCEKLENKCRGEGIEVRFSDGKNT